MAKARAKQGGSTTAGGAEGDTPAAGEAVPFEAAIERLEAIVSQLEDGDLDLERSLAAFEEGVALSKSAAGQLEEAERRIEVLMSEGGDWVARPFEEEAE